MKAVFLHAAQTDLHDLRHYLLRNFDAATWQSSYRKIKESIAAITQHPQLGMVPPELEQLGITQYRQVICGMNRILYEVRGDTLYVHLVCDTRRNLHDLLLRRLVRAPQPVPHAT